MFRKDIGIDLGTASTVVFVRGKGIVFNEPSVVAIEKENQKILKIGEEAKRMLGRTPGNIAVIRPLKDGVISNIDATSEMLKYYIHKACKTAASFKPRVVICIPSGVTEVERRAVKDAAKIAGAAKIWIIEEPKAAAIGAGLDITKPSGIMVVDIGGGTTDIAVLSLSNIVLSRSVKIAGDKFDDAIIKYIRRKHNILIGERTAEEIKMNLGGAIPREESCTMEIKGRCLVEGLPKSVVICDTEIQEALEETTSLVCDTIHNVLENTPPELVSDIIANGIVMTGGGSLLYGFDRLVAQRTGIRVYVANEAISCVALGTGKCLESLDLLDDDSAE
ncbi:MAG: rod shape-determining protein MreB [Clostridia bacterium]|nr:rod shape-determining protein MreB [Clostridia bacterium]